MKKIVVSASGEIAAWRDVSVLSTIDPVQIASLKREPGKNIVMYGSLSVVLELSAHRLIDEYQLLVHPIFCRGRKAPVRRFRRRSRVQVGTSLSFGCRVDEVFRYDGRC
jgi:hypothetical protein